MAKDATLEFIAASKVKAAVAEVLVDATTIIRSGSNLDARLRATHSLLQYYCNRESGVSAYRKLRRHASAVQ